MPVTYRCSNCGAIMDRPYGKCPRCGVNLILNGPAPQEAPSYSQPQTIQAVCKNCRAPYKIFAIVCEECGEWISRGTQIFWLIYWPLMAAAAFGFMIFLISLPVNAGSIQQIVLTVGGVGLLFVVFFLLALRAYRNAKKIHERLFKG